MICNGIDTDRLAALGQMMVTNPDASKVSARVRTRWEQSYRTRAKTQELVQGDERIPRDATLPMDLPRVLGGGDDGPAPGEMVLAALGSCVAQAFIEAAAMSGIQVDRLEISAEGHLDLRGNAGVEGVRPGMSRIFLDVDVESDAKDSEVDRLLADALRRSPIADSLTAGVHVSASLHQTTAA